MTASPHGQRQWFDPRNPLSVLGMFVSLAEVGLTTTMFSVQPGLQPWVLAAMVGVALTTLALFGVIAYG